MQYLKDAELQPVEQQGWPQYGDNIKAVMSAPSDNNLVGLDLEWHVGTNKVYMASVAHGGKTCSVPVEKAYYWLKRLPTDDSIRLVGHNIISADLKVLHDEFGTPLVPKVLPIDTLIVYYIMNQHLCQGAEDKEAESTDFDRGPGKLNLSSMASRYLLWAEYKTCRGDILCSGPCPNHDEAWYNALDALAPIECFKAMRDEATQFTSERYPGGIPLEKLTTHVTRLQIALNKMTDAGILCDRKRIAEIREQNRLEKEAILPRKEVIRYGKSGKPLKKPGIEFLWGFNPDSPKDVKEFFNARGIRLPKSDSDHIKAALRAPMDDATRNMLQLLLDYKAAGRGIDNWFADQYIDDDDRMRPTWKSFGGAMARPVSSAPNVQNIHKRGKLIIARSCWIPRKGYKFLKADAKQGEPRCMLYIGGMDPKDIPVNIYKAVLAKAEDIFSAVVEDAPEYSRIIPVKGKAAAMYACAKQTVMAFLYAEGLHLVTEKQLGNYRSRYFKDKAQGSLWLHEDWIVNGKMVCFDGKHLADRYYKDSCHANRAKALTVQRAIARVVPEILVAQKKILAQAEQGYVVLPSGRLFQLVQDETKNIRTALAAHGQITLTDYMQEALLRYDNLDYLPTIYIHDEFGFEVPVEWDAKKCNDFLKPMSEVSTLVPNFQCPTDAEWGPNYYDLEEID